MDFFSVSRSRKFISFRLGKEIDSQPSQDAAEIMEVDTPQAAKAPEPEVTDLPAEKRSLVELSSTTDTESCEAYISRTVELLASVEPTATNPNDEFLDEAKASTSDPLAITPGLNELLPDEEMPESVPRVVFLDKPDAKIIPTVTTSEGQNELVSPDRGVVVTPTTNTVVQQEQTEEETAGNTSQDEQRSNRVPMDYRSQTDEDTCFGMETDTGSLARSTLAQALYRPAEIQNITCPGGSSSESVPSEVRKDPGPNPLSATSRVIIKQCFTETNPICLDLGHPVIALNPEQITSILRIVADESARPSFEMLNSVVQRARKLNLGSNTKSMAHRPTHSVSGIDTDTDVGSVSAITFDPHRDNSSTGVTSEGESHPDFQSSVTLPTPPTFGDAGLVDPGSRTDSPTISSPGTQTLAAVRKEAINEQRQTGKRATARIRTSGEGRPRRRVG